MQKEFESGLRKRLKFDCGTLPSEKATNDVIFSLDWQVLPHSAYAAEHASSDYYLFRSM